MITFKKIFYDLYDLKKEKFINDFDIYSCIYDYDYLLKYWKKKNFKRFIINFWINEKKYNINFNNDKSKNFDLKNEIQKQVKNNFMILDVL